MCPFGSIQEMPNENKYGNDITRNGLLHQDACKSPCRKLCNARWFPQAGQSNPVTILNGHFGIHVVLAGSTA